MKKARTVPKGRIIALSIFLFLLAVMGGGIWYWNTHKESIIRKKMEKAVRERSKGLYKINYDDLKMDELAGYMSVSNMVFNYDSARYITLDKEGEGPSVLLNIQIPEITASGVKTSRILFKNEIAGQKLEIKNPVINIRFTNSGSDTSVAVAPKKIFEQILGNINLLQVDTILISGAQVITHSDRIKKTNIRIENIAVKMIGVKVDSLSNTDTTRMLFAKEAGISCETISWSSANKLYSYSADSISINSLSRHLRIGSFRVTPLLGEEAFIKANPAQDYRFDLSFGNIQLQNINLPQLFDANIVADSVLIHPASIKIYCDAAIKNDTKERIETYPLHVIESIPVPLRVRKILLSDGFVEYKERGSITRQPGRLQFSGIQLRLSNVTNDKDAVASDNIMKAELNARLLKKVPMKTTWSFYLLHPNGRFDVKGSLGAMDGTLLNPIAVPLGPSRINKGKLNSLEFSFRGNDDGMDGRVKMLYENFNITMLEKDKGAKELDRKSLQSTLANLFIINSNPRKRGDVRIAQVHIDRKINQSIFYLVWKTLLKGIEETLGIGKRS